MIAIYIDTNTINSRQKIEAINALEKLAEDFPGKVSIEKTDTLDTELLQNSQANMKRLQKSARLIESYGIAVVEHSRIGHSVVGTSEEDKIFGEILIILFGKKPRNNYTKNEIRDAQHIYTAVRYGGRYFITYDKELLAKSEAIKSRFNSLIICSPEKCLELVLKRIEILKDNRLWNS